MAGRSAAFAILSWKKCLLSSASGHRLKALSSSIVPRGNSSLFLRGLSSNQLATALRPFYFAVHPDLFGRHPKERAINENSLKHLNAYLEMAQNINRTAVPAKLTFYLKKQQTFLSHPSDFGDNHETLKSVDIEFPSRDLRTTVHHILKCCDISTSYLDSLPLPKVQEVVNARYAKQKSALYRDIDVENMETEFSKTEVETLKSWIRKNHQFARTKLESMRPILEETERLQYELCKHLGIRDILWSCGWGIAHFKGCLQSLESLRQHHPEILKNLNGRTVVFGNMTGVNLDGHVILSSEDVRNSWLELIKAIHEKDLARRRIPAVELTVSRVLRDIKVVHRKFQPAVAVQTYENHLRMLSAKLADFWVKNGYPSSWPPSLNTFQLVVECDAGPLMLSPTGQFIVPASCPASLVASFITENLNEANRRLLLYKQNKRKEEILHDLCVQELELTALRKDDNVTPDRMIRCAQRLLECKDTLLEHVRGAKLNVTHFYSVLDDGEMCLPWNCV